MLASRKIRRDQGLRMTWRSIQRLCFCILLAVAGCGRSEVGTTPPTALRGLDPQIITRRGDLHFVADVAAGCNLAAEQGRPCFLFFTADWCTFCHQMEETSYRDPRVAEMAANFVCVLVDADRYPEVCRSFSVTGYPTVQFVSANGRVLNRLVGRQSAAELVTGMRAALKRFAWLNDSETTVR